MSDNVTNGVSSVFSNDQVDLSILSNVRVSDEINMENKGQRKTNDSLFDNIKASQKPNYCPYEH